MLQSDNRTDPFTTVYRSCTPPFCRMRPHGPGPPSRTRREARALEQAKTNCASQLSEHRPLVFGVAAVLLAENGVALWYGRSLPCPTDPDAAQACRRLRRFSAVLYGIARTSFALGVSFAFVLPHLGR